MTLEELLARGFFPKELPPPFQTEIYAGKLTEIETKWHRVVSLPRTEIEQAIFKKKYFDSKWAKYSIPKFGFSRRSLAIPNPFHQTILAKSIIDHYADIQSVLSRSAVSFSKPVADATGQRALKMGHTFAEFKHQRVLDAFDKSFEIKTDISRYYGTIYTHSIPWAIHTKPIAKARKLDQTLLGNILDKNVRNGNSAQTIGIPIGPDTSLILSELIGCTMDEFFLAKHPGPKIKTFRYVDDYYIYCSTQEEAEQVIKSLQSIFDDFQLEMNEEKTIISKVPFPFESHWAIELGTFSFESKTAKSQQTRLERFASVAFIRARENPNDHVLSYAIGILRNVALFNDSWDIYEALILKMALSEPAVLAVVTHILISYRERVSVDKVRGTVLAIIAEHLYKSHHYEVCWSLYLCKEFEIAIPLNISNAIFASQDVTSIMVALDLRTMGLTDPATDTTLLEAELSTASLMEETWLLTYESIYQSWLPAPAVDPVTDNEYFNILRSENINFYEKDRSLDPFVPISAEEELLRARKRKAIAESDKVITKTDDGEGYDSGIEIPFEFGGYDL